MKRRGSSSTARIVACLLVLTGCTPTSVRRPTGYNASALTAIQSFKSATVVAKRADREEWNATVTFGTPAATATVIGGAHLSMIRVVSDADAPEGRQVYERRDYTNNLEIRVKDSTLFVYRAITLMRTEYRLAVFDLATRRRVADHLVSPEDMPPTKP